MSFGENAERAVNCQNSHQIPQQFVIGHVVIHSAGSGRLVLDSEAGECPVEYGLSGLSIHCLKVLQGTPAEEAPRPFVACWKATNGSAAQDR